MICTYGDVNNVSRSFEKEKLIHFYTYLCRRKIYTYEDAKKKNVGLGFKNKKTHTFFTYLCRRKIYTL